MPDPEEEDILFLQLPVLFKMKKKKEKKTKNGYGNYFVNEKKKKAFNNLVQEMKLADRESFFRKGLILLKF